MLQYLLPTSTKVTDICSYFLFFFYSLLANQGKIRTYTYRLDMCTCICSTGKQHIIAIMIKMDQVSFSLVDKLPQTT